MRKKNKLMGLESLNDINFQKDALLNQSYEDKDNRIGTLIRRKRIGDSTTTASKQYMHTDHSPDLSYNHSG